MEKLGEKNEEANQAEYIIKCSATLKFNEFIELKFPGMKEEDKVNILCQVSRDMYEDLLEKSISDVVDSVGVWIKSGKIIHENSISLSDLEAIQQHGEEGIIPIYEFIKMTLQINE